MKHRSLGGQESQAHIASDSDSGEKNRAIGTLCDKQNERSEPHDANVSIDVLHFL